MVEVNRPTFNKFFCANIILLKKKFSIDLILINLMSENVSKKTFENTCLKYCLFFS